MIFSRWFHPKTILLKLRMWFWLSLNAILKVRAGLGTFFENSFEILMKNAIRDCWKKLSPPEPPIHHILLSKECIWNVFTTGNIVRNYPTQTFLYCVYMQWMWEKCYQVLPPYLTLVLDPFMDQLDMSDKIALLSRLIVTFRARVIDLFMDRLDMSVGISLCCCLKLTFRARVLDSFEVQTKRTSGINLRSLTRPHV